MNSYRIIPFEINQQSNNLFLTIRNKSINTSKTESYKIEIFHRLEEKYAFPQIFTNVYLSQELIDIRLN